jgi:hypothetical protein
MDKDLNKELHELLESFLCEISHSDNITSSYFAYDDIDKIPKIGEIEEFAIRTSNSRWPKLDLFEDMFLTQGKNVLVRFNIENNFGFPMVKAIEVNSKFSGHGYGLLVYKFLLQKFGGVFSDISQSKTAHDAWRKLFNSKIGVMYEYSITYQTKKPIKTLEQFESVYDDPHEDKVFFLTKT